MSGIEIELEEERNYYVRYWKNKKKKDIKDFHGKLIEINLDNQWIVFSLDEHQRHNFRIDVDKVVTIVEIKSKGKRLLKLTQTTGSDEGGKGK